MDRQFLEFLFVGPLFSIFKLLNKIRREIVGLKDELRQLNTDLNSGLDNVASDLTRLEEKIANTPAAEDVSEELASLRSTVNRLQGLDIPDPEQAGDSGTDTGTTTTPGVIIPPNVEPDPADVTTTSPGEPGPNTLPTDGGTEETPAGTSEESSDSGTVVVPSDPSADPVPAESLPAGTPTVPADSVDNGTVAPDAPITPAEEVTPTDAPVVPVETSTETGDSGTNES
jgi:hypothetical protein